MARYSTRSWRAFRPHDAVESVALTVSDCRVLGIDPGSQRTGYGIIDCHATGERHVASGCIDVAGQAMVLRLQRIYAQIQRAGQRAPAGHDRDRAGIPASQSRQRAEARAGARRGAVRGRLRRRQRVRVRAAGHQDGGYRLRRGRQAAGGTDGAARCCSSAACSRPMLPMPWRRPCAMRRRGASDRSRALPPRLPGRASPPPCPRPRLPSPMHRPRRPGRRPWGVQARDDRFAVRSAGISLAAAPAAGGGRRRLRGRGSDVDVLLAARGRAAHAVADAPGGA